MENFEEFIGNSQTEVTISKPSRVIHCGDGIVEVIEEEQIEELESKPSSPEEIIDPKTLTWGPWFSHYALKSSNKLLNAVDYAGESLASFFGITDPKYQIEINEYERIKEEKQAMEEEYAGWVKKGAGDGNIPLVLNEPSRNLNTSNNGSII